MCTYLTVELLSKPDHAGVFVHREIPHGLLSRHPVDERLLLGIHSPQLGHGRACQAQSQRSEVTQGQRLADSHLVCPQTLSPPSFHNLLQSAPEPVAVPKPHPEPEVESESVSEHVWKPGSEPVKSARSFS